jgi:hypothetical protein
MVWLFVLFVVSLPIAGGAIIWFGYYLLRNVVPSLGTDNTKPRTDLHMLRAGYASFVAGVAVIILWAIGTAVVGVTAGLRLLFG